MIRLPFKFVLACLLGLVLQALPAAAQSSSAKPPPLPVLSDAEILRCLSPAQRQQWDVAQKNLKDGQSMIDNGKWIEAIKPDPNTPNVGVDEAKKAGKEQEANGTALVATANQTLADLRLTGRKAFVTMQAIAAAGKYQLIVPAAQWPDVVQRMSDSLLKSLATAGYGQVYLGDVYAFDHSHYSAKPALTNQVRQALSSSDVDHKNLTMQASIKLVRQGSDLVLDFPDRATSSSNSTAAVILGEVLFEPDSGYAYFSLRAVDLNTGKIIHNELALLSVEPTFGKGLDLVAYQVPAQRVPAPVNASAPQPADVSTATITLQDNTGVISTFKSAAHPYLFQADTAGSNDTLENRVALLLVKSLLTEKSPLSVTDYDFLVQALPADNPADRNAVPSSVNATWLVSSLRDLDPSSVSLGLKARRLPSGADVNVGRITIDTSLKTLVPPTPDQLIAAGYQLTPPPQFMDATGAASGAAGSGSSSSSGSAAGIKHSP